MKKTATRPFMAFIAGISLIAPICISLAAEANSSDATSSQPAAAPAPAISAGPAPVISTAPAPVKLPYGVEDVLKLSRAQISEDIVLNYVHNSGTIYTLTPKEIVYLRDQGVSDKVISAMLDQRKRVELAAQNAAAQAVPAPSGSSAPYTQIAPDASNATDPSATYAEAPLTPPASSLYVIPYSPSYYDPYYYPYPYYYGGWWGPSVAFGFRFGGHGGFHGGGGRGFGGHGFGGHHR